jgi:RNA recognition motif-containing protein
MSSAKLRVGNLSYETSQGGLRTLFERHGAVASVTLMCNRASGRSRGFALVEMGTAEEAQAAKSAVDGAQLDGRSLTVDDARE